MQFSKAQLAFLTVLAAGVIGLAGSLVLSPSQTYGLQTDEAGVDQSPAGGGAAPTGITTTTPAQPASGATGGPEALPPQAPLDQDAFGSETGADVNQLPSAGSGGYLDQASTSMLAVVLFAFAAMLGSGSVVWAYANRYR